MTLLELIQNALSPKKVATPTPWTVDPVQQARINNERKAGLPPAPIQQQVNYALGTPNARTTTPPPTGGGGGNVGGGSTGGGEVSGGGGFDFNALLNEQRALARSAYEEGVRRATSAFERAKGIYDEGVGLLGKRRDEFKSLYSEGSDKILDRYEGERGNLQTSAKGAATRSANSLRALGLGGSAMIKSEGKLRQEGAKSLGTLQTQRNENETANTRDFNERQTWADTQQSALTRSLNDAGEARRAAEEQSGLIERGDVAGINSQIGGFLQSILNNQLALNTAKAGVGNYTANPFAVNIDSLVGSLSPAVPTVGGTTTPNSGVNLVDEQQKKLALLRQQAGGNLYGLRA